ncbi:MAG: U32 family peptidase [Xanthomonadales bacterium]|nr:putative protease YhbU [Xanthomonadales bacterium]MCC6593645.1 U32 family peptidase [Xanthomonadales bacterium]MCE7931520.1 U32 family peptidase [Xanthomonadales bacterium PRO6]
MRLVCPAGSPPAFRAALDAGADAIYLGFRDETNARAFPGLNFGEQDLAAAVHLAHAHGREVYLALNTYPTPARIAQWRTAVDRAAALGVDAIIAADPAVLEHAANAHPELARHLSVQGSATTPVALRWYRERFGIARAVLPRVLSVQQVEQVCAAQVVPIEVFAFGSLCIMVEGRCQLSSHVTGASPNRHGVCSPARAVRWEEHPDGSRSVRLSGVLIDQFAPQEPAGYPTICKGRYRVGENLFHALEAPTSLNTLELLPRLAAAGVVALKIEGRQRGAAYVGAVARVWRAAIDALARDPTGFAAREDWQQALSAHAEGRQTTLGAYQRGWQ